MVHLTPMSEDLPKGWVWTQVKDIAEFIRGVSYRKNESSKTPETGYIPILRANNINKQLNYEDLVYVPREKVKDEQLVKVLDIVIAMSSGSKHLVGKAAQAYQDFEGGFGTFCGLVRVLPQFDRKFIGLFFHSPGYRNEISRLSIGININNLRRENVETMFIPIPPLAEQHRIVAKLEGLFSQLDAAVDSLKKAHAQLQRYCRSILKSAFEGELTRKWRERYSGELELMPVSEVSTLEGSPELPDGWVWTTLEGISEITLGQSPPSSTYNTDGEGLPFYQGKLEFGKLYPTPRKWCTKPKKIAKRGDVFISIRAPVGPTNLCPEKSAVGRGLAAIRGLHGIKPLFILYLLRRFENEIASRGTGTTFEAITGNHLKTFEIPLPPLAEQEQIVSELGRHLSGADEIEATIASELKRSECLRQSILKHAFSGKLVPQDPNDESASVLLEKIQVEKKQQQPKKRKKTTKPKVQKSDDYPLLALAGGLERNDDSIINASLTELRGGKGEKKISR